MDSRFSRVRNRPYIRVPMLAIALLVALLWSLNSTGHAESYAADNAANTIDNTASTLATTQRNAPYTAGFDAASPDSSLLGYVVSQPLNLLGVWLLETGPGLLEEVVVLDLNVIDGDTPGPNDWVKVDVIINLLGLQVATNIELDIFEEYQVITELDTGVLSSTIASRYGLSPISTIPGNENIVLYDTLGISAVDILASLLTDTDLVWSELNYLIRPPEGDPYKTWGWGGTNSDGYVNQSAFEQVNLDAAEPTYDGTGVTVAILDTGVDYGHPALTGTLLSGIDLISGDSDPQDEGSGPMWGHGTHAAGIITRMAPESDILPVRVLDSDGRGNAFALAYGIAWAADQGADVINLSLGTDFDSVILETVTDYANAQGAVLTAAAGNQNVSMPQYPAAYDDVLGVTAVDGDNVKAPFTNYGSSWVDIAAPGVGITSTVIGPNGRGYASWSGTSMATPFVAGAAALASQKWPTATSASLVSWLRDRTQDIDSENPGYEGDLGGLLDLEDALEITSSSTNTSDEQAPSEEGTPGFPEDDTDAPIDDSSDNDTSSEDAPEENGPDNGESGSAGDNATPGEAEEFQQLLPLIVVP